MEQKQVYDFPTEEVDLPSKGLIYPSSNPLASGKVTMRYMTTRDEDTLTNPNYIENGTVIDKLLKSLIVDKNVNYDDIIVGDKDAIMIAARIMGYGKDYSIIHKGKEVVVDLSKVDSKPLEDANFVKGKNEFSFTLPKTGTEIKYKLLNNHDEKKIQAELKGLKKINPEESHEISTRLKFMILSIGDETDPIKIRKYVDNQLLAMESKALRDYIKKTQPGVNFTYKTEGKNGIEEDINIPITTNFFWPDSGI
mgnify:CR=1 FL=1